MKYIVLLIIILLFSCNSEVKQDAIAITEVDDTIELEVYDFDGLEPLLNKQGDKVYVVNFWATWCAPCIKEIPHFEKLNANYKNKNVEVLLVSLDFPFNYDKKLKPYIKKHKLQSKVVVLDDPDMNSWMSKVSEEWTGAIPVTIIYNKEKRQFYERTFTYNELENEVKQFLN
ncbi:MAG: TlpA family protein disulfide reductase [Bacteroidetes bacterium]|nr:TlpA family protein disulfide reductase [Bacteroidota bacterium]